MVSLGVLSIGSIGACGNVGSVIAASPICLIRELLNIGFTLHKVPNNDLDKDIR